MYNTGWGHGSKRAKASSLRGGSQWITPTTGGKIKEQIINVYGSKRLESEETRGQTYNSAC